MKTIIGTICVICNFSLALASDFLDKEKCGEAKITEGFACPDIKVQFSFQNCLMKSETKLATSVQCKDKSLVATFIEGNYRYTAQFEKTEDSWGAVT